MDGTYLDIHLAIPENSDTREIIPAVLSEYPFEGFEEDERGIHCFIKKKEWRESIDTVIHTLAEQFHLSGVEYISTTEIEPKNWNDEWEKSIRPIQVTDRIVITPSWHPVDDKNALVITIDPKMTFGTGYHESTRLMIRMMEHYPLSNKRVLDVGTGTGILAICAALLGAQHVIAIDIDDLSLENGHENVRRNHVQDRVEIRIGSLETVTESEFEFVFANIIRNTILELINPLLLKLSPSGTILLAGLLTSDRLIIENALVERNFIVHSTLQENDWIAIAASRK